MGVFPKELTYLLMRPMVNNLGMRLINSAKFWSGRWGLRGHRHLQSHAGFAFLLDYVPNWKWAYKPGGLIQYQLFIPKEKAAGVFRRVIQLSQEAGMPSYLGVMKRHQPDPFLMTHALDGYSLALDYKVTEKNRSGLWALTHRMDEVVLASGGKFYFAKDSTLEKESIERYYGKETLQKFMQIKEACDPQNLLQTNLTRRLFDFHALSRAGLKKTKRA
jgi:FAD/FMN-containing dehydrogenase